MPGTNHTNYDAIFCGKQPLHNTNLIQSHGALIAAESGTHKIVQVSENIDALLGMAVDDVVGLSLADVLNDDSVQLVNSSVSSGALHAKVPSTLYFSKAGKEEGYLAHLHQKDDLLIIEVEFTDKLVDKASFIKIFQQVKQVVSAIEAATTVNEVCIVAANVIKELSGFDKVMIYSFDEGWNGTVVAEAMEQGMDSYFGLKFPASDVPKQARELYLSNPYRLIPNRDYVPVPLSPYNNPVTNTFTDLSSCKLRSVAPVHLEYLRNMGVVASMSTRIIHREQLWGLIACHHRQPKYLSFEETSVFELLSSVISTKITSIIHKTSLDRRSTLEASLFVIKGQMEFFDDLLKMFMYNKETLLSLLSADGVSICWNGEIESAGLTPEEDEVQQLRHWLMEKKVKQTLHMPALSLAFAKAEKYAALASGLLALPIDPEVGNYILAYRPEAIQQVKWGGNPDEVIKFEANSSVYHPRNSFAVWKETIKQTAVRWTDDEVSIVEKFRNILVEYSLQAKNKELVDAINEFKFVANLIPPFVWTAKANGKADFFNDRWIAYTGLTTQESVDDGWSKALHPADEEHVVTTWLKAVADKKNFTTEGRFKKTDGSFCWFLIRGVPLLDNSQNVIKWFGTCTNIDDRKQMEQVLEQKVADRTEQLRTMNNELERTNKELKQYAFIASHDLQEPIRKIQVFGNIIKEHYLQSDHVKAGEYLDRIIQSSIRMKSLIIDLLTHTSLSGSLEWKRVDLNEVLQAVWKDLEHLVNEKHAALQVDKLPVIISSEEQMRQVFHNMLSNSLLYSSAERNPEISITAQYVSSLDFDAPADDKGQYVKLVVTDNGVGFNPIYSEKIFQIFQRLQPKTSSSGTGIGLSIVQKIIEIHKGLIKVDAVEEQGATFTIILPLKQEVNEL
ncbi:ATP-binding protein [Aridibaculum aurantiacum]|uniref:ATP-binding protein n=1 Tax=Aridibaculum aurantiacum TaxID=2810307 RepID=UPI001A977819|nr:ATP-binding protein [Aridibaculum aurantiacum]